MIPLTQALCIGALAMLAYMLAETLCCEALRFFREPAR